MTNIISRCSNSSANAFFKVGKCIILAGLLGMISGCSAAEKRIEDLIIAESGINETVEYQEYARVTGDNNQNNGKIKVSLAVNRNIGVDYYLDPNLEEKVEGASVYMNTGDSLYYTVGRAENRNSSQYGFDGFIIQDFSDPEHIRTVNWPSDDSNEKDNIVFTIPADYYGSDLSVLPVGSFGFIDVYLDDYYNNTRGNKTDLDGKWTVNNELISGGNAKVTNFQPYSVLYEYDTEKYYFKEAEPKTISKKPDSTGRVVFEIVEPDEQFVERFSVQLGKYETIKVKVDGVYKAINGTVTTSTGVEANLKKETDIQNLKEGDIIDVYTDDTYDISINGVKVSPINGAFLEQKYRYDYKYQVDSNDYFNFNPSKYSFEHGKIRFKLNGREITNQQKVMNGSELIYEAYAVEEGYYLPTYNKRNTIIVNGLNTDTEIKKIRFYKDSEVTVNGLQSQVMGGNLEYYVNGKKINSNSIKLLAGSTIEIRPLPWSGWNLAAKEFNRISYLVTDNETQTLSVNWLPEVQKINTGGVFVEGDNHKPAVNVTLKTSLNQTGITFDVIDTAMKKSIINTGKKTADGLLDTPIVQGHKVNTGKPIRIDVSGNRKYSLVNEVLKVTVTKKLNGESRKTVKFIESIPQTLDIPVYEANEIASHTNYVETIDITISKCKKTTFDAKLFEMNNAVISVTPKGIYQARALKTGDIIDESDGLILKITPKAGYSIMGATDPINGIYKTKDAKQYSKLISEFKDIKKEHYPVKQYTITFPETDDEGKYKFWRTDGTILKGEQKINDKETISLKYTITDNKYYIEIDEFRLPWDPKRKEATKAITIKNSYDNSTLTREDFGIKVKKE